MDRQAWKRPALKRAALATAVCSFAAHGFLFSNEFFSHDSVSYFTYATGTPAFYTGIGRFLIPLYEQCKGDVAAPWLIGLLFLLWMTGTALAVTGLLEIRSSGGMVLTCALLCTNTALTLTGATYVYCLDEYAFALLCAALAAWLFNKNGGGRGGWRWAVPGVLALIISLAVYQAYFTVAAALCFLSILRRTACGEKLASLLRDGFRQLGLLAMGFLLYYGLWSGVCAVMGVEKRRVEESLLGGGGLGELLLEANRDYFRGLFDGGGVLGRLLPAVHGLLLCGLLLCLLALLRRPGLAVGNKLLLAALACLTPTALSAVSVLMAGNATGLMTYAGELIYLLPLVWGESDRRRPVRGVAAALLCLVVWQHVVYANQVYMKKELEKNATLVLAARVLERIETTAGYVPGETAVAFAGRLDRNPAMNPGREAFRELEGDVGLWSDYASTYNLGRYLTDYLHAPLLWDQTQDLSHSPEVAEMPVFPETGSVAVVDGIVVVKLSSETS